jgi:hypothetical protein
MGCFIHIKKHLNITPNKGKLIDRNHAKIMHLEEQI